MKIFRFSFDIFHLSLKTFTRPQIPQITETARL
jgi:hypothetical protein